MTKLETIRSGKAFPVDVTAIRQEMKKLWKEAAAPGTAPVTRACLMNLVVWFPGGRADSRLAATIANLVQAHPARVIMMETDLDASGDLLEAWVSAHCTVPSAGAKQVCSEQVTLRASLSSAAHLPGLLAGLLASDLPVCLFAPRRPSLRDPVFRRLTEGADHLLVDSAGFTAEDLRDLHDLAASLKRTSIGDVNWSRLRPLQDEIAGFFDPPFFRPQIPRIGQVETRGGTGSEASGRLLAGWVRAVLEGRPIAFRHDEEQTLPEGFLGHACLRTEGGEAPADFVVEADPSTGALVARVQLEGTCPVPRRAHPPAPEPWELVASQMMRLGSEPLYAASLAHAAALP